MSNKVRRFVYSRIKRSIAPLIEYCAREAESSRMGDALYNLTWTRAIESSVQYADANMQSALMFRNVRELWDFAAGKVNVPGLCLEFGVFKGKSINHFASRLATVYGFDSFEGLQEDWSGWGFAKGSFDLQGKLPKVAPNVRLVKGWFNDTLPRFLDEHPGDAGLVHVDCDTYEATKTVLDLLEERLVPGTVIVFDEYFGYRGWEVKGEFTAWREFTERTAITYEYLAFCSQQVAVQVRSSPMTNCPSPARVTSR